MIALGAIVMCGWLLNWQRVPVLCHDLSVCIYKCVFVSTPRPDKVEACCQSVLDACGTARTQSM